MGGSPKKRDVELFELGWDPTVLNGAIMAQQILLSRTDRSIFRTYPDKNNVWLCAAMIYSANGDMFGLPRPNRQAAGGHTLVQLNLQTVFEPGR